MEPTCAVKQSQRGSGAFEQGSDALATANTEADHGVTTTDTLQLMQSLHGDDCAGCTDRMTQRNAAAVRVQTFGRQFQLTSDSQCLSGEGFVDFITSMSFTPRP